MAAGRTCPRYILWDRKQGVKGKDVPPQEHVMMALIPSFGKEEQLCVESSVLPPQRAGGKEEGRFPESWVPGLDRPAKFLSQGWDQRAHTGIKE